MSPSHLPYAQSEHRSSFNMGAQPAHAPESSASISVDGRSRPMEPGTQSTRHSLYSLNGIQGSGSGSSSASVMTGSEGRFSQSFNLVKFYMDRDGPWHPLSKNSTDSRLDDSRGRNQSLLFGSGMASNFSSWRESVPSECDTIGPDALMSDSGYGSMAKASVGIPSHYGGEFDHNLETHSIIGHFSDIQLHGSDKGPWGHQSASQSQAGSDRLTCQTCLKQVKNRSELNKHNLRHTKPYSCDIPGCQRDRGFSTKNDLARHKESVHKTNGIKYVCNLGPCKSKNKIWPRADNFRQHLKRIHNRPIAADDEELRSFIYTSPDEEASSASYEQPLASNVQESRLSPPHWGLGPSREEHMGIVDDSSPDSIGRCEGLAYSGRDGHTENSFFPLSAEEDDHDDEQSVPLDTLAGDSLQFQHMLPHDPVSQLPTCSSTSLGGSPASGFSCIPPDALSHASLHEEPQRDSNDRCKVIDLVSDETTIPNLSEQQDCFKDDLLAEDPHHKPSLELLQTEETSVAIEPDASRVDIAEKREASSPGGLSSLPTEETNEPAILAVLEETQNPEESPAPESKPQVDALVAGTGAHDDEDVSNILKLLQEKGLLEKALGHLGYQKKDQSSKPKKPVGLKTPVVENNYVQCTECHKTFKRKCELKKHSKRHERPYGCTHPGCPKRFGSKNDWKRHENSQHFMLAVWKCEEKLADNPSQLCGKACYRRETFRHHLQKSHSITDAKITEEKLESCRLGQNCESRFWCGFCEMKIEVKGKGGEAWTERFNHIDDHFSGRKAPKKDIKDWKNVDPAGPNTDEYTSSSDAGSRAGTPELLADGRDGRSATTVTPSPAGGARKRAIDDAADGEPDAKRRKGVGIWWFCCQCRTQNTVVTNSSCMESVCNHDRCVSCKLENHRVQEYEEDGERSSQ